jgi:hypothetical protein
MLLTMKNNGTLNTLLIFKYDYELAKGFDRSE